MKRYSFIYVVAKADLSLVNELKEYFEQKIKVEIIDYDVTGTPLARVTLHRNCNDYEKEQKRIEEVLESVGLAVTLKGVQHNGQSIVVV